MSHLVDLFYDTGMAKVEGEVLPLGFPDIAAFKQACELDLSPFDVVTLKKMSDCYVTWIHKGKNLSCQAPFFKDDRPLSQQREETFNKFKALGRKHGN